MKKIPYFFLAILSLLAACASNIVHQSGTSTFARTWNGSGIYSTQSATGSQQVSAALSRSLIKTMRIDLTPDGNAQLYMMSANRLGKWQIIEGEGKRFLQLEGFSAVPERYEIVDHNDTLLDLKTPNEQVVLQFVSK